MPETDGMWVTGLFLGNAAYYYAVLFRAVFQTPSRIHIYK